MEKTSLNEFGYFKYWAKIVRRNHEIKNLHILKICYSVAFIVILLECIVCIAQEGTLILNLVGIVAILLQAIQVHKSVQRIAELDKEVKEIALNTIQMLHNETEKGENNEQ